MGKSIPLGTAVGLMAVSAAVTYVITSNVSLGIFNEKISSVSEKEDMYSTLSEADSFARTYYISDIDPQKLLSSISKGYVNGLSDPYAAYYTADEFSLLTEQFSGYFTGLGFTYEKDPSGYAKVTSITEGSSADENGISAGDIVMAVNNVNLIAYPGGYNEAVKLFTPAAGTKVKLQLKRTDENDKVSFFNVDLVSSKTEIISVTGRTAGNVGVIHISEFNDTTPEQFTYTVDMLLSEGADRFLFDVRDNAGGKISSLTAVLEEILPPCEAARAFYKANDEPLIETTDENQLNYPMAVLINNGTKGEAELFAYILKDEKNAVTVGKTSYGKGVLQETFRLSDGGAIKFSVASMQSKSRVNFTGIGIKPDYDVNQTSDINPYKLSASEQDKFDAQFIKARSIIEAM